MISFDEQVAIVTGAGGGLGRTYALELARRGAAVVVNDLGGDVHGTGGGSGAAEAVVKEIEAEGGRAVASTDSVTSPEGGEAIVRTALDAFGRVDVLINNAGILRDKSFAKLEPDDVDRVLDVHLRGAFFVSRPAFLQMKEQGYGRLLFTSSGSGLFGNFGQANYGAAKMGLAGLSGILALEGARFGIQSNAIAPIARTRMTDELFGEMGQHFDPTYVTPLAIYLVSRDCPVTKQIYTAGAGWYSRVVVGTTPGWFAGSDGPPDVEAIHQRLGEIDAPEGLVEPEDAFAVMRRIEPFLS